MKSTFFLEMFMDCEPNLIISKEGEITVTMRKLSYDQSPLENGTNPITFFDCDR